MVPTAPKSGTVAEPDTLTILSTQTRSLTNSNNNPVAASVNLTLKQYSTKVAYTGHCNVTNPFTRDFWTGFFNPTQCEIRGLPQALPIKVFSPDSYILSFSFPTPKKLASGTKWIEGKVKPAIDLKDDIHKKYVGSFTYPFSKPSTEEARERQWGKLKKPWQIGTSDRPVKFEKNGQSIEIKALDAFAAALLLQRKIWGIKELIMHAIPKAGFYMDAEIKIL
jgi:hypothetical protein